jgi:hypothetical protein
MASNDEVKELQNHDDEEPVLTLIQALKDGRTDPKTLSKDLRQRCVEVFLGEGYSVSNMAQVLKKSEKTIKRDVNEIRERNALSPDVDLAKQIIGDFVWSARVHRNHLMRLARGKDGSVGERAQAEYYAYIALADCVSKLQSLGYLPSAPQAVVGEIFHRHSTEGHITEDLNKEIIELEKIIDIDGEGIELRNDIEAIKNGVKALELKNRINDIKEKRGESHDKVDR